MVTVDIVAHGETKTPRFSDGIGHGKSETLGYFFSAPSSPIHFFLQSAAPSENNTKLDSSSPPGDSEFDFSSRLSSSSGPIGGVAMNSAEELFSNGQIKPMKLSTHLQRPQNLAPLLDLGTEEEEEEEALQDGGVNRRGRDLKLRSGSVQRKARSLSPLRNAAYQSNEEEEECIRKLHGDYEVETKSNENVTSAETTPSSSRSSSYGRNSKKWIFLKDLLLHRSKSEGSGNAKERFWSNISFSPVNLNVEIKKQKQRQPPPAKKSTNGIAKRRGGVQPSAHELHYTTNIAQAEEMKKRTYLPYRHGLFGCLGFSSKGYTAFNGLARSLNPVSSG